MKKVLCHLLLLVYVFFIPIYYYHLKDMVTTRHQKWEGKLKFDCQAWALIWPITACVELVIEIQEFLEFKANAAKK